MEKVTIIPSKSFAHRAMICATLAGAPEVVQCDFPSKDIEATRACMQAIQNGEEELLCGESGSTLRFLLPVMGALGQKGVFQAEGRLPQRPLSPLYEELERHGCSLSPQGEAPIVIEGQLTPGEYVIPGDVSSQFISGLLLALPVLKEPCTVRVTGRLESSAYIEITLEVIRQFGVLWNVEQKENEILYSIDGNQTYHAPETFLVEGDWSGAAFWICAGAIGPAPMEIHGLNLSSIQGDRAMVDIARAFGADIREDGDVLTVSPSALHGATIDVAEVPDLAPAIAILAAAAEGESKIVGAARLRIKESDRLRAIAETLDALDCTVTEGEDFLVIEGQNGKALSGGKVDGFNDHRIVMMAAILSLLSRDTITIDGKAAVAKSYPNFFEELQRMQLDDKVE